MNDQFMILGLQLSVVTGFGVVIAMYLILTVYAIVGALMGLCIRLGRQLYKLVTKTPLLPPVVPQSNTMPLPTIRRKVAFK